MQELEHKARRQDVLVDEETIAAFYGERVPDGVYSLATFERWRVRCRAQRPARAVPYPRRADAALGQGSDRRTVPREIGNGRRRPAAQVPFCAGPPERRAHAHGSARASEPGRCGASHLACPGMVREKVALYLKALPKATRNRLVPLPDTVTAFLEAVPFGQGALPDALREYVRVRLRDTLPASLWEDPRSSLRSPPPEGAASLGTAQREGVVLPPHLVCNIRVVDAAGAELASGRDLAALRNQLGEAAQLSFAQVGPSLERRGLKSWDFGDLPETLTSTRKAQRITGFPALVDDGDSVSIALLDTREKAEASTRAGVIRLIRFALKDVLARFEATGKNAGPPGFLQAALQLKTAISTERLQADVLAAITDRAFIGDDPLPRSERAFAEQVKRARTRLPAVAEGAYRLLAAIAAAHQALSQHIAALPPALARVGAECALAATHSCIPGSSRRRPGRSSRTCRVTLKRSTAASRNMRRTRRAMRAMPPISRNGGSATGNAPNATARRRYRSRSWRLFAGCSRSCRCRSMRRS